MPEMNMIEAIRQALDEELARDEDVFLTGNDIGENGRTIPHYPRLAEKIRA